MSIKHLTVEGTTFNSTTKAYESRIFKITYEVDDLGGQQVDLAAFTNLLNDYVLQQEHQSGGQLDPQTKVGCFFSKELLLFLLSFDDCKGIIINKCFNSSKNEESFAVCPVDQQSSPVGSVVAGQTMKDNFVGGEWGTKVTYETMRKMFPASEPNLLDNDNMVAKLQAYFTTFSKPND